MFILQGNEFVFVSEAIDVIDSWRTQPPQLLDVQFQVGVPNHWDHGESKYMKNSWVLRSSIGVYYTAHARIRVDNYLKVIRNSNFSRRASELGVRALFV